MVVVPAAARPAEEVQWWVKRHVCQPFPLSLNPGVRRNPATSTGTQTDRSWGNVLMDDTNVLRLAVLNNVEWCQAVCRTHAAECHLTDRWWINHHPSPPLYPNLITCQPDVLLADILPTLETLNARLPAEGWGVKDSFDCLDLARHGFFRAFRATWLWRAVSTPLPVLLPAGDCFDWCWMESPSALQAWTLGWSAGVADDPLRSLFTPALLDAPGIGFLAALRDQTIVGGVIVNCSAGVVGLSNLFARTDDSGVAANVIWKGLILQVSLRYPERPQVCYEATAGRAHAEAAGFQALHPLSVWIRGKAPR